MEEDPVMVIKDGRVVIYDDDHPYGYIPVPIVTRRLSLNDPRTQYVPVVPVSHTIMGGRKRIP